MTRYGYLSESMEDEQVRLSNENASACCDSMFNPDKLRESAYKTMLLQALERQRQNIPQKSRQVSTAARPVEKDERGVAWIMSPECQCCGKRGLIRLRPHEYKCPRTKLEMRFYVRDEGYFAVPLKTAKAMEALGRDSL